MKMAGATGAYGEATSPLSAFWRRWMRSPYGFYDIWQTLDWDELGQRIPAGDSLRCRAGTISASARSTGICRTDFTCRCTLFGKNGGHGPAGNTSPLRRGVNMYLPLYLTNLCANDCSYCGFSMSNKLKRKVLDEDEARRECEVIRQLGYETLLLVTGEP